MTGLSPEQLDELCDKVLPAVETIICALIDAGHEAGHRSGCRPPEWGPGLEPCVICHEPWLCRPMQKVSKATHGVKKALLALGVDEEVVDNAGARHRPGVGVTPQ